MRRNAARGLWGGGYSCSLLETGGQLLQYTCVGMTALRLVAVAPRGVSLQERVLHHSQPAAVLLSPTTRPPTRDLKPANLMISGNLHADVEQLYLDSGVVKVADFGLSKSLVPVDRHGSMSMSLTQVGGGERERAGTGGCKVCPCQGWQASARCWAVLRRPFSMGSPTRGAVADVWTLLPSHLPLCSGVQADW